MNESNYFTLKSQFQNQAGHNFEEIDDEMVQQLVGTEHEHPDSEDLPHVEHLYNHPPNQKFLPPSMGLDSFDGLKQWKYCPSVKKIRNQGRCASDWVSKTQKVLEHTFNIKQV